MVVLERVVRRLKLKKGSGYSYPPFLLTIALDKGRRVLAQRPDLLMEAIRTWVDELMQ